MYDCKTDASKTVKERWEEEGRGTDRQTIRRTDRKKDGELALSQMVM